MRGWDTMANDQADPEQFGTCCELLAGAMSEDDFEPLFTVGEDGILYMAVGLLDGDPDDDEDDEAGMVDHPVFFCPFCGTKLQDPDAIQAQLEGTQ